MSIGIAFFINFLYNLHKPYRMHYYQPHTDINGVSMFLLVEAFPSANGVSMFLLVEAFPGINGLSMFLLVEEFPGFNRVSMSLWQRHPMKSKIYPAIAQAEQSMDCLVQNMNLIPLRLCSYRSIGTQSMDPSIDLHNRLKAPIV